MTLPGAARLDRALAQVELDSTSENVARAAAELVLRTAQQGSRSRRVRATGKTSVRKRGGTVRGVVKFGSPAVPFTAASHFGHGTASRPRGQGGWMPKNPFLHRAADQRSEEVIDLFLTGTTEAIRKAGL